MRLWGISLLFLCYWKGQWGLAGGSMDDRNLSSFLHLPFPQHFPLLFWSKVQSGSGILLLSAASHKPNRRRSFLGGWDMEMYPPSPTCCYLLSLLLPSLPPLPLPPPTSSNHTHKKSPALFSFFFIHLPFLLVFSSIPQPMVSGQHETTLSHLEANRSPLAASDKTHLPCSLLSFSLLINEDSVQ